MVRKLFPAVGLPKHYRNNENKKKTIPGGNSWKIFLFLLTQSVIIVMKRRRCHVNSKCNIIVIAIVSVSRFIPGNRSQSLKVRCKHKVPNTSSSIKVRFPSQLVNHQGCVEPYNCWYKLYQNLCRLRMSVFVEGWSPPIEAPLLWEIKCWWDGMILRITINNSKYMTLTLCWWTSRLNHYHAH